MFQLRRNTRRKRENSVLNQQRDQEIGKTLISSPASNPHSGRSPFAVLRRAKNIKNASEKERESLRDHAERLENACAWMVFLGIGLEVVIVLASLKGGFLRPLFEKIGYLIADSAIALGVYGEMRFGHVSTAVLKITLADATHALTDMYFWRGFAEEEMRETTDKLADTQRSLALAVERAAKLEIEAAEARERTAQIERLTARRHLSIPQRDGIIEAVRTCPRGIRLLIEFHASDSEALVYAGELSAAFGWAGVTNRRVIGNSFLMGTIFGVLIAGSDEIDPSPFIRVFSDSEAPLRLWPTDLREYAYTGEVPNLYIFVAPKPSPDLEPVLKKAAEDSGQHVKTGQ